MGLCLYIHTLQLIKIMKQIVEHLSLETKKDYNIKAWMLLHNL